MRSFSTILYSPEKLVCAEEKFPPYKVKMTSDVNQTVFERRFYSSKISQESKRHEKKGLVSRLGGWCRVGMVQLCNTRQRALTDPSLSERLQGQSRRWPKKGLKKRRQRKCWGLPELSSVAETGFLPQDNLGRRHSGKGQAAGPWTPLSGVRLCPS